MESAVVKGQEIPLLIKRIGINGEGIGYYKKQAIFVDGALPDEEYSVIIDEVNKGFAKGHISRLKIASKHRVKPFCPYYEKCGACQLQHVDYLETLNLKRDLIFQAIERYTKINPRSFEIKETIGLKDPLGYRNKASLPVAFNGEKAVVGIYELNTNHLVHIDNCPIQAPVVNQVVSDVLKAIDKNHISIYNQKSKKGAIKYLVVRSTYLSKKTQVTIILNEATDLSSLVTDILKVKNVSSVYQDLNNDPKSNQIFGNSLKLLAGDKTITEELGEYRFDLLPNAFFQLNPEQTVVLYDAIKKSAKLTKKEIVYDLYCGVGTIGIWVSKLAKEVIAIEDNKNAALNAIANMKQNKVINMQVFDGAVNKLVPKLFAEYVPDVILVDPPRTGMGQMLIELLNKHLPKRIIYTSCNPSTMAKDIDLLSSKYQIKSIVPVDLFPFTARIECVTLLELKK